MRPCLLAISMACALGTAASASANDCENAMDQMTMNECADLAFKKTDSQLNAVYQTIERRLKSGAQPQKLLIAAERAWIAFRDAECTFTASAVAGGSMQPMVYSGCLDQMTKKRIDDLKGFLQCEEGDLSCPLPPAGK